MSQRVSSSKGQIRQCSGQDESEEKQKVRAFDRVCTICKGAQWLRMNVPYGDPS